MKKFFKDFKEFATKGNIIDMAVGVVIGGAFKDIVNALVAQIITPFIVLFTGKASLSELAVTLKEGVPAVLNEAGEVVTEAVDPVIMNYGVFLQAIIDFLIIALTIFIVLRVFMTAQKKMEALRKKAEEEAVAEAPAEPAETELDILKEIRDSLKK